ncbi:MAG: glycosyltransferase [Clostridia bacterium]|nr:glycosyltransferase [Clostridia bacterium]
MKILLVSDAYRYTMNGVAGVVITLADTLRALGHETKVISMSNKAESFKQGDDYFIASFPVPVYPEVRQTLAHHHPFFKEIKEWRPDVIHVHTEGSAARIARSISKATGAPLVITLHTDYVKFVFHEHSQARILKTVSVPIAAIAYRRANIATAPSKKAEMLLKGFKFKHAVRVIPNGIKLERFRRDYGEGEREALFEQLGIPDNGKLFVCVSRLSAEKNIEEILRFFPAVLSQEPEARLMIVGDGPDKKSLMKQAAVEGLGGRVLFTGRIPQDDLFRYYKAGIAFISASTFEIHSLTYLEAMACGLPLICRDDPSIEGVLLDGENGYVYHNKEEFVDRCVRLLRDAELQKKLADFALRHSEEFSDIRCAERMLELYQYAMENYKGKGK